MPIVTAVVGWLRARTVEVVSLIQATIAMLVGFGALDWTPEQTALVMAVVTAALAAVAGRARDSLALHALADRRPLRARPEETRDAR